MKKLTIPNGGMPFEGDDLTYMQQALAEGIGDTLRTFSPTKGDFIISGVNPVYNDVNDTLSWSSGVISVGYEPCKIDAGNLQNVTDYALVDMEISSTFDPSGLDVFADSVSKDTYEVRKATFVLRATQVEVIRPVRNLHRVRELVHHEVDIPVLVGPSTNWLKLRMSNGFVTLEGFVEHTLDKSTLGAKIADIPTQYKPLYTLAPWLSPVRQWRLASWIDGHVDVRLILVGSELRATIDDTSTSTDLNRLMDIHQVSWWV